MPKLHWLLMFLMLSFSLPTLFAQEKGSSQVGQAIDKDAIAARALAEHSDLRQDVALAIEGSVRFLLDQQDPKKGFFGKDARNQLIKWNNKYPVGSTLLTAYALATAKLDPQQNTALFEKRNAAVKKALAYVKKQKKLPEFSYEVGVLLMALEAAGDLENPEKNPYQSWIKSLTKHLLKFETVVSLNSKMKKHLQEVIGRFGWQKPDKKKGGYQLEMSTENWSYQTKKMGHFRYIKREADTDLSNMQYVLLGMKAASRCGVEIPKDFWWRMLHFYLLAQAKDGPEVQVAWLKNDLATDADGQLALKGSLKPEYVYDPDPVIARGFPYKPWFDSKGGSHAGDEFTYTMTTSGLGALLICRDELYDDPDYQKSYHLAVNGSIRESIAFLSQHERFLKVEFGWDLYALYGVERCGVMARTENMGSRLWFREGCQQLLETMQVSGEHKDRCFWNLDPSLRGPMRNPDLFRDVVNASFALLFLGRATLPSEAPRDYQIRSTDGS